MNGAFEDPKPLLGTTPSAGSAAISLIALLHFGYFARLLSKVVWFSLEIDNQMEAKEL